MKVVTRYVLALAGLCVTTPCVAADFSLTRTTTKSVPAFRDCFVAAQGRARNVLSFIPNERGGVFSNDGAARIGNAYTLRIIENGRFRTVIMNPANPLAAPMPPVAAAIEKCL